MGAWEKAQLYAEWDALFISSKIKLKPQIKLAFLMAVISSPSTTRSLALGDKTSLTWLLQYKQRAHAHSVMKQGCYVHSVSPVDAHAESCFSVGKGISSYVRKTLEIHTSNMVLWPKLCPHSRFMCWNHHDFIRAGTFSEEIKVEWVIKVGPWYSMVSAQKDETPAHWLSAVWGHSEKVASWGEVSHQKPNLMAP